MPQLTPDASERLLLSYILGKASPGDQMLKLFVSDTTPGNGDAAATYTEMTTHGYAAKTLTSSNWSIATVAGAAVATYPDQTFTFTSGPAVTVHGYYRIDSASGLLLAAERLDTPIVVQNTGDAITIPLTFALSSSGGA